LGIGPQVSGAPVPTGNPTMVPEHDRETGASIGAAMPDLSLVRHGFSRYGLAVWFVTNFVMRQHAPILGAAVIAWHARNFSVARLKEAWLPSTAKRSLQVAGETRTQPSTSS
jgi:hypothetical protein